MASRIAVLDDALVDQIAAGEVIERPASVVKELVDNAIDAGAERIVVEVSEGGVGLIRVSDDGMGMSKDDAVLAVRRHATSKLRTGDDLFQLQTFGFRGEALASIASVSHLTLTTKERDAGEATRVRVENAGVESTDAVGAAPGTAVEVRDLFYNVPARKKFLKTQATELAHVADVCLRAALTHPALHITLLRDGRSVREFLPVRSLAERATHALSSDELHCVEGERDGISVAAMLGPADRARSGASGLYLFVNGRAVQDRGIARAVAFAYGDALPPGKYPTGVVHLRVPSTRVDVNVHPQKAEVRFDEPRVVFDAVSRILAPTLSSSEWVRESSKPVRGVKEARASYLRDATNMADLFAAAGTQPTGAPPVAHKGKFGGLRVLSQVRRMLLVCEGDDALTIIDQHAADERVRFHRLRKAYRAKELTVQRLLFPERVELGATRAPLVDAHQDALQSLGLEVTRIGESTVAIHAIPNLLRRATPAHLLASVLDGFDHVEGSRTPDAIESVLLNMACHGALRAGDALSPAECGALLRALDEVDEHDSGDAPLLHGNPVVYTLLFHELERRRGRA